MANANTARILDDLRQVVDDTEALLRDTSQAAGEGAHSARARMRETIDHAKERLSTLEAEVMSRSRDAARETDRYVRSHPWQSIGIAAGAGLLLGMLITRR
jgi:ElaB/YqjD/DUF883 family membrane-anchored ribosome-binding protein